jgi:hypothetical protein
LLAVISKENTLHLEPSSCQRISYMLEDANGVGAYSFSSVVEGPDGLIDIYSVIERVRKCWPFGY